MDRTVLDRVQNFAEWYRSVDTMHRLRSAR
jgi:hypothetical protein